MSDPRFDRFLKRAIYGDAISFTRIDVDGASPEQIRAIVDAAIGVYAVVSSGAMLPEDDDADAQAACEALAKAVDAITRPEK